MTTILHILQHALGRDEYGRPTSRSNPEFRNHYCVGPRCDGFDLCRSAVEQGLMREHAPREISGGDYIFTVTDAGRAWVTAHSPNPPHLSRSAQRYRAFLNEDGGENFGEWLRLQKHRRAQA